MTIQISSASLQDGANRISNFIKVNKRFPTTVTLLDMNTKKKVTVSDGAYFDIYKRDFQFAINNNRFPNYVTSIGTSSNAVPQNYQDSSTTCGPTSLSMISAGLFKYRTEAQFKQACGTTSSGTSPANMISGAGKLGFKMVKIDRNISAVKQALSKAKYVLAHIQTRDATCLRYIGDYGHWVVIKGVSGSNYIVNDPTKGPDKVCASTVLDNATNGRAIYYYSVELA